MLHPAVLVAIAVVALNDHVLKGGFPGFLTGKLSDVAGVAFFPVMLVAGLELAQAARGTWRGPDRRAVVAACALTALSFALVKSVPAAAGLFGWGLGAMQWPVRALLAAIGGASLPHVAPAVIVADPSDLLALPGVLVWLLAGLHRASAGAEPPPVRRRAAPEAVAAGGGR